MPIDLKIVDIGPTGALFGATWPSPDAIEGEYNLVQRIYKNLLTDPGDDEFYPEYGSGLRAAIQGIPGQNLQEASKAVQGALRKCMSDIQADMGSSTDKAERITSLELQSLEYDYTLAVWRAAVTLQTAAETTITIPLSLG